MKLRLARRPILTDLDHFLQYFFKSIMQQHQAKRIIELLKKKGEIREQDWQIFVMTSVGLYTKTMRKLRDAGLVEKREGYFRLSREFLLIMKKFKDYWSDFLEG